MAVPVVALSEVTSPAPPSVWREVMAADPNAMATQSPEWLAALRETSPYADASHLFHFSDGRRVVLPMARHRRLPRAWAIEGSWPHGWGPAGPLADGPVTAAHAGQVYACLLAETSLQRSIRIDPRADPGWSSNPPGYTRVEHFTQILDLGGGFDQVREQRFGHRVRRAARTAVSSGVEVEADTSGRLLPVFHELHHRSLRHSAARHQHPWLAARTQAEHDDPLSRYAAVARHLGSSCATWVAWHEGVPVASILVLSNGRHARYWRGAVDSDLAAPLRADVLLHVQVVAWACATDHQSYYLGDSRPDSRLARFKADLGATPYHSVGYRSERLPLGAVESRARRALRRLAG